MCISSLSSALACDMIRPADSISLHHDFTVTIIEFAWSCEAVLLTLLLSGHLITAAGNDN